MDVTGVLSKVVEVVLASRVAFGAIVDVGAVVAVGVVSRTVVPWVVVAEVEVVVSRVVVVIEGVLVAPVSRTSVP